VVVITIRRPNGRGGPERRGRRHLCGKLSRARDRPHSRPEHRPFTPALRALPDPGLEADEFLLAFGWRIAPFREVLAGLAPASIRRLQSTAVTQIGLARTGCRLFTVTMADRAPAQLNTAVAQRLEGTSRTLSTDHILQECESDRRRRRTGVATPSVETIIDWGAARIIETPG
jgi:hypothetical protein